MAGEENLGPSEDLSPEELEKEREIEEKEMKENPELFKKNTEWMEKFLALVKSLPLEEALEAKKRFEKFIEGEITWAELQGISPEELMKIAEQGYLQFERGKYPEAEKFFKLLCLIDPETAYYHTALGAIHQKKENWIDALAEYTVAVEMDPQDIAAYVNRGEIYYREMLYIEEALADFEKAIELDPKEKDPWAHRARFLKSKLLQEWVLEEKGK